MKKIIISLLIVSLFLIGGCMKESTNFRYGIVYSSMSGSDSKIVLIDDLGQEVNQVKTDILGISLTGFMKYPQKINNKVYMCAPASSKGGQPFLTMYDIDESKIEKVAENADIISTTFYVNERAIFGAAAAPECTYLWKSDYNTDEKIIKAQIPGITTFLLGDDESLYAFSMIENKEEARCFSVAITVIDREYLTIDKEIMIQDAGFITDVIEVNNKVYILSGTNGKDLPANKMFIYEKTSGNLETVELPFQHLSKLHEYNGAIYIVQYPKHDEIVDNLIGVMDIESKKIEVIKLPTTNRTSYIVDDQFISCDGNSIYEYDMTDFSLKKQIPLITPNKLQYTTIFVN